MSDINKLLTGMRQALGRPDHVDAGLPLLAKQAGWWSSVWRFGDSSKVDRYTSKAQSKLTDAQKTQAKAENTARKAQQHVNEARAAADRLMAEANARHAKAVSARTATEETLEAISKGVSSGGTRALVAAKTPAFYKRNPLLAGLGVAGLLAAGLGASVARKPERLPPRYVEHH